MVQRGGRSRADPQDPRGTVEAARRPLSRDNSLWRVGLIRAERFYHENRALCEGEHPFRHAAHEELVDARPAVAAHDDHAGTLLLRRVDDRFGRGCTNYETLHPDTC